MKSWVKVLLWIAVGIAGLGALGIGAMVRSGRWDQAKRFAGGMTQLVSGAKAMEEFEKSHPFTLPADGLLRPERLETYLQVCALLKPYEKPFNTWVAEHSGKQGDFREAAEAVSFLGKVTREVQELMRARGMGTRELAWVHRTVREAQRELADRQGSPRVQALLRILERTVRSPELPQTLRDSLAEDLARFRAEVDPAKPLSANARLVQEHQERMAETDPGELLDMVLGSSQRRRGAR
ncbi:MAG: hypothetical protein HY823_09420 [Acidobacteria bacterium]|nr:hypothetical protein [Acidobacteriota bacterium]